MKKVLDNYLCKCGHSKNDHLGYYAGRTDEDFPIGCGICVSDCPEFELDNLKYLEEQYAKRNI